MRRLLDTLTRLIAWMHRKQVFVPNGPTKVNLGSGLTVADGWVNIDSSLNALASRFPKLLLHIPYKLSNANRWYSFSQYVDLLMGHVFIHHDLTYGIPLPDNCADYIYSGHFIEHISRDNAEYLFREAHRVLKPQGRLRLNTPSFEKFVASYQTGNGEPILNALFAKPGSEGWYNRHHYIYDFELLSRLLEEAGFVDVVECEDGIGSTPDLDVFEGNRPSRYLLFVEASALPVAENWNRVDRAQA